MKTLKITVTCSTTRSKNYQSAESTASIEVEIEQGEKVGEVYVQAARFLRDLVNRETATAIEALTAPVAPPAAFTQPQEQYNNRPAPMQNLPPATMGGRPIQPNGYHQ